MSNWSEAAEKYRLANPEEIQAKKKRRYQRVLDELEAFLKDQEGREALGLLEASARELVICEYETNGYRCCWMMDTRGFFYRKRSLEENQPPSPQAQGVLPKDVLQAYVDECGKDVGTFMSWLRYQLDLVAADAPEPGRR